MTTTVHFIHEAVPADNPKGFDKRGWTHEMCWDCWWDRYPVHVNDEKDRLEISRWPVQLKLRELVRCCYCGQPNRSAIFMRADPNDPDMACAVLDAQEGDLVPAPRRTDDV